MHYTKTAQGNWLGNNLVWKAFTEEGLFTYEEALEKDGWRLPTIEEILSIVDTTVNSKLPDMLAHDYWSSTTHSTYKNKTMIVFFGRALAYFLDNSNKIKVRLVKDSSMES